MYGGESSHLPLKINQAGVIPAIFASALLLLPVTFSNFSFSDNETFLNISSYFTQGQPLYMLLYASGIIFFTTVAITIAVVKLSNMADNKKAITDIIIKRYRLLVVVIFSVIISKPSSTASRLSSAILSTIDCMEEISSLKSKSTSTILRSILPRSELILSASSELPSKRRLTLIKEAMENAYTLSVPLDVEMDMGVNWLEAH